MSSPLAGPGNPAPARFQEAVDAFRARVAVDGTTWAGMTAAARSRAFGVAGLTQLGLVQDVWKALDKSVAEGETFADFKKRVGKQVQAAWGGTVANPGHRLETIYRTNLATAYSRGTWTQLQDPLTRRVRPFILSQVPRDERNSDVCRRIGTVVLPADSPWWLTHWSPLHHRCRRTQSALTERQAKARGVTVLPPAVTPAPGFGAAPGQPGAEWVPDVSDAPPALQSAYRAKEAAGPPPPGPDERLPRGPVRGDSAAVVEAELPRLAAALGDKLRVDGAVESQVVRTAVVDLEKLPDALLRRLYEATTDVHFSAGTLPTMGRSGKAGKAMKTAKQVEGADWETVGGIFFNRDGVREVLVSGNESGSFSTAIHEAAHALDALAGDTKSPAFRAAWQAFRTSGAPMASLDYYTREDVGHFEAFAEAFALFWSTGGRDFGADMVRQQFGPELAEYLVREYGAQKWSGQ